MSSLSQGTLNLMSTARIYLYPTGHSHPEHDIICLQPKSPLTVKTQVEILTSTKQAVLP